MRAFGPIASSRNRGHAPVGKTYRVYHQRVAFPAPYRVPVRLSIVGGHIWMAATIDVNMARRLDGFGGNCYFDGSLPNIDWRRCLHKRRHSYMIAPANRI